MTSVSSRHSRVDQQGMSWYIVFL